MVATAEKILEEVAKLHEDRHWLIVRGAVFFDDLYVTALSNHHLVENSRIFHALSWIERKETDEDETDKENDGKGENHKEETLTDVLKQIDGALIPPEVNEPFSKPF